MREAEKSPWGRRMERALDPETEGLGDRKSVV